MTRGAVLAATVKDGKLIAWDIQPASRKPDVVLCQPQASKLLAIPSNVHPLRVGLDQNGGNRFRGEIGRVTMFRGKLSPRTIRDLAVGDRTKPVAVPRVVGCRLKPKPGDKLPTSTEDFVGSVSFEAWICPADKESGRVLDKLTAGQNDGFLLDTFPGLSLRLIIGDQQRLVRNVLKPGVWQHVAVVLDRGLPRVFLDGRPAD